MLSGKALVPGMEIESSCDGVARPEKPRPTIRTTNSTEHRNFMTSPRKGPTKGRDRTKAHPSLENRLHTELTARFLGQFAPKELLLPEIGHTRRTRMFD